MDRTDSKTDASAGPINVITGPPDCGNTDTSLFEIAVRISNGSSKLLVICISILSSTDGPLSSSVIDGLSVINAPPLPSINCVE